MIIYRVESRAGRGPYRIAHGSRLRDALAEELQDAHGWAEWPDTHPTPREDGASATWFARPGDWRSGFASPEQVTNWFGGWMSKLNTARHWVSTYTVPPAEVEVLKHQAIFNLEAATLLQRTRPSEFARTRCVQTSA